MKSLNVKSIFGLLFLLCIFAQSFSVVKIETQDIDKHLEDFSAFNISHHDNIDDDFHGHTHKHSEHGQEHEHNHDHVKTSHAEIQTFHEDSRDINLAVLELKKLPGFFYQSFFSDAHLQDLFRPPIV